MERQPYISIITATLNHAVGLKVCLDSVFSQTHTNWEHIIVDGDSSDGTKDLLRLQKDTRVRWISEPDCGIADAMNKGIRMATGDWLLFLHADDRLLSKNSLTTFCKGLEPDVCMVSYAVVKITKTGKKHTLRPRPWGLRTAFKTTVPHQGAFIRREMFLQLGNYDPDLRICMDYDWFLRAYWAGSLLSTRTETIVCMGADGLSSKRDKESLKARFAEERKVHFKNAPNQRWRMLYWLYWFVYPSFAMRIHRR